MTAFSGRYARFPSHLDTYPSRTLTPAGQALGLVICHVRRSEGQSSGSPSRFPVRARFRLIYMGIVPPVDVIRRSRRLKIRSPSPAALGRLGCQRELAGFDRRCRGQRRRAALGVGMVRAWPHPTTDSSAPIGPDWSAEPGPEPYATVKTNLHLSGRLRGPPGGSSADQPKFKSAACTLAHGARCAPGSWTPHPPPSERSVWSTHLNGPVFGMKRPTAQ